MLPEVDPKTLIRARAGAILSNTMPYIEDELAKMAHALDHRMFAAAGSGELTPEMALAGWMERYAYQKLLKHFQTSVRLGVNP